MTREFSFPVEVLAGSDALRRLDELRRQSADSGLYPVLLGDADDVEAIAECLPDAQADIEATISAAQNLDVTAWLARRLASDPDYYTAEPGKWPEPTPGQHSLVAHCDVLSGKPKPQVSLTLIDARAPWEIPAHLTFGDWNECPPPVVHVALAKKWYEEYGAEIVSATGELVEFVVARPPNTREQALALADEQFVYCPDLVHQGTETLSHLAASLLNAEYWYFWWD